MTYSRSHGPDLAVGLFVLLLGALALWQAAEIPTSPIYAQVGPKAVPYVVGAGLLALGAGLAAAALHGGWSWTLAEVQEAPPTNWRALGLVLALVLTLAVWFGFVEVLGVNIGAGLLEGLVLRALGQEVT